MYATRARKGERRLLVHSQKRDFVSRCFHGAIASITDQAIAESRREYLFVHRYRRFSTLKTGQGKTGGLIRANLSIIDLLDPNWLSVLCEVMFYPILYY